MTTASDTRFRVRPAQHQDVPALHAVIQRAYRGDSARQGWTHEADLLDDERITPQALAAIIDDPASLLLLGEREGAPIGSVQLTNRGAGEVYLGLFCIDPAVQAGGMGKNLLEQAESAARNNFGATRIVMTVIEQRIELIAYYERRGYVRTGARVDFPTSVEPPLYMVELAKNLA